jgi:SAM-dependent methyltransferase
MPDETFWRERFQKFGIQSVGTGASESEENLEEERLAFHRPAEKWIRSLPGPILDFGCGVGRWVPYLPKPYYGLDLLPEHLDICKQTYESLDTHFLASQKIGQLTDESMASVFTCTVLQHIVEKEIRRQVIRQFYRLLKPGGILMSIEWSDRQRDYDWCKKVTNRDFAGWFQAKKIGEIQAQGLWHNVWIAHKKPGIVSRILSYIAK